MGVYEDQAKEFARTPSALVTLGMRYCANWYAQTFDCSYTLSEDFTNATIFGWAKPAGTTVTANTHEAPDGATTADTLAFAAVNDYIEFNVGNLPAVSKAYTASVFFRSLTGTGTITVYLRDGSGAEIATLVCNLTTTWQRFYFHKLFTAGATFNAKIRIEREAGDLASVVAWGANVTRNPNDRDAVYLWPYVPVLTGSLTTPKASSCTATDLGDGSRCFYSFPTCQDREHFNAGNAYEATKALQGLREFRFCRKDTAIPLAGEDIRPHILSLDWAAQKIDPERAVTQSERIEVKFADDKGPGLWDQQKSLDGALVNTALEQGSFWRRFRSIFRNWANPDCYAIVKRGFVASGMTEALYAQRGKFLISNVTMGTDGNVSMSLTDPLKLVAGSRSQGEIGDGSTPTGAKGPPKISTTNVLTAAVLSSATSLPVTDASEFTEPGDGYTVTVLVDTEKFNVTARDLDTNTLTVTPGRWGTTTAGHVINSAISEVIEFGTERSSPGLTPLGKNPIDCVIEILRRGSIPEARIDRVTLEDERDTWLPSTVDTATGSVTGTLFRRTLTKSTDYEKLLVELREILMLDLWVNEEGEVTGRLFAPARPTVTLATLTDDANLVADSVSIDENDESRVTRVLVAYDLISGEDGKEIGDFLKGVMTVEPELEARAGYGRQILKAILSQWVQPGDSATASMLGAHYLGRYRQGARKVKASVELKDDARQVGDFVYVTTALLQDAYGATDSNRQMQIIKKAPQENGRIELEMIDADGLGNFGFIAPASQDGIDWDVATPDQRRYIHIASASGTLGTGDEAFRIW